MPSDNKSKCLLEIIKNLAPPIIGLSVGIILGETISNKYSLGNESGSIRYLIDVIGGICGVYFGAHFMPLYEPESFFFQGIIDKNNLPKHLLN